MKNSKFDKLYSMIMQWAVGNADYLDGRIAFNPNEASAQNGAWPVLKNGKQLLDVQGNPVYWEVMAPAKPGFDCITGQKIKPNQCICLSYTVMPKYLRGLKGRTYVLQSTYLNAYNNNDEATIAKLQSIGLGPGFDFGVSTAMPLVNQQSKSSKRK